MPVVCSSTCCEVSKTNASPNLESLILTDLCWKQHQHCVLYLNYYTNMSYKVELPLTWYKPISLSLMQSIETSKIKENLDLFPICKSGNQVYFIFSAMNFLLTLYNLTTVPYSPFFSLYISFGTGNENLFSNQSFFGWWSFPLFSWS